MPCKALPLGGSLQEFGPTLGSTSWGPLWDHKDPPGGLYPLPTPILLCQVKLSLGGWAGIDPKFYPTLPVTMPPSFGNNEPFTLHFVSQTSFEGFQVPISRQLVNYNTPLPPRPTLSLYEDRRIRWPTSSFTTINQFIRKRTYYMISLLWT